MYPPLYEICEDKLIIQELLGNPPRIYPFDEAPQDAPYPLVIWHEISGRPENYLAKRPDICQYVTQVDVYAPTAAKARQIRNALFYVLELHCHIVRLGGEFRDKDTRNYRCSFHASWYVSNEVQSV